jgi:hypothetical protein
MRIFKTLEYFTGRLFLILPLFIFSPAFSQSPMPEWGYFSPQEISLKECSFDPEAEAVILLDEAVAEYDDDYRLITRRRVRIKILNARGLKYADVSIPFYSKNDFESVDKIEACTHNFDAGSQSQMTMLDKKSVFKEKRDDKYSLMKFPMPAVKEGSIIEYRYEVSTKTFSSPDDWYFQNDIPTIKSAFLFQVPPRAEFTYQVQRKNSLPIIIKPLPNEGKVYFEMNNIPALRYEPYMDAPRDYVQKVAFQLSGVVNRFGHKQDINTTWKSLANELMTEKYFGSQLDKDLKVDEVKRLADAESTASGKMNAIYNYVRNNFTWNGYHGIYAPDGLKAVWERKKGSNSEINLLLINFLNTNGVEVYPMLVAERDYGKIDPNYPFIDRFNKTVAFVMADGKQYILDATEKYCPAGLTPYQLLNTLAFIVDKKKPDLVSIASNKAYRNKVTVEAVVDERGKLHGNAVVESTEYSRQDRVKRIKSDQKKFITEQFEKPFRELAVDSFRFVNLDAEELPLIQHIRFSQQPEEGGDFVFLNYNFFIGLEKNPFTSSIRFTNVNFGYPYVISMEAVFRLPAGSKMDLPKDRTLQSTDGKISLQREIKFENGEIKVKLFFTQSITLVTPENYPALKEFYKNMVDMLSEAVIIKLPL